MKRKYLTLKILANQNSMNDVGVVVAPDLPEKEEQQFQNLTRQLICYLNDTADLAANGNRYHVTSLQVPNDGRDYRMFLKMILDSGNDAIKCSSKMVYILDEDADQQEESRARRQMNGGEDDDNEEQEEDYDEDRPMRRGMGAGIARTVRKPVRPQRRPMMYGDQTSSAVPEGDTTGLYVIPNFAFLPRSKGIPVERALGMKTTATNEYQDRQFEQQVNPKQKKTQQRNREEEEEEEDEDRYNNRRKVPQGGGARTVGSQPYHYYTNQQQ